MIDYNNKLWFRHLFSFHKSDTLRVLGWEMLIVGLFVGGLTWAHEYYVTKYDALLKDTSMVHSIIGFVISLLLVFRTNTAYDRWWEGRKLWGALVNNTRNLAVKLNTMLPDEAKAEKDYFAKMIPNFVFAFKEHLRGGVKPEELDDINGLLEQLKTKEHQPNYIVNEIYRKVAELRKAGHLSDEDMIVLDKELKSFLDILGACERIKNTPIPYSYNIFLKKFIFFYLVSLPFSFIVAFEYAAVPIVMFIFYVLVSLEIIAEEIEDPFGRDDNDLPLDNLSHKIKGNVQEIFAS